MPGCGNYSKNQQQRKNQLQQQRLGWQQLWPQRMLKLIACPVLLRVLRGKLLWQKASWRPCRLGFDVHPQIASCLSYHIKSAIVSLLAVIQCCLIGFHIESFKKVSALSLPCNSFKIFLVNEKGDLLQTTVEAMSKNRDMTETRMIQVYFLPLQLENLMMLIITKVNRILPQKSFSMVNAATHVRFEGHFVTGTA